MKYLKWLLFSWLEYTHIPQQSVGGKMLYNHIPVGRMFLISYWLQEENLLYLMFNMICYQKSNNVNMFNCIYPMVIIKITTLNFIGKIDTQKYPLGELFLRSWRERYVRVLTGKGAVVFYFINHLVVWIFFSCHALHL